MAPAKVGAAAVREVKMWVSHAIRSWASVPKAPEAAASQHGEHLLLNHKANALVPGGVPESLAFSICCRMASP